MPEVAVIGVGNSEFGKRLDVNLGELAFESIKEAIEDAGVEKDDLDSVAVGSAGGWYEESQPAVVVAEYAGLNPVGLVRTEAACATGSASVRDAYLSVAGGEADVALAVGVEKMTEVDTSTAVEMIGRAGSYLWEFEQFGLTFPGYYAMYATAHMAKYGTTREDLSSVAVKAHKYGAMNSKAQFQSEITIEKAMSSPVVAWPLTLYHCSPITDGSAAVVLASKEKAEEFTDSPVWIESMGVASDTANLSKRDNFTSIKATVEASEKAYSRAGTAPEDLDVATVHDCFTIAEIMAYEDLGFCERGEGSELIRQGETERDGWLPTNLDGGLKAKGHPIGATGASMFYEITKQLRGEAGRRQAEIENGLGLVHNVGGTGHTCYVTVMAS